jgi:hypothetical protein
MGVTAKLRGWRRVGKITEFTATPQIMVVDIGSLYKLEASSDHYLVVAQGQYSNLK